MYKVNIGSINHFYNIRIYYIYGSFILLGDMGSGEDDQYKVADAMHKKIKQLNKKR